MRRLPIYFLIDVSESMIGEPIEQVQEGIGTIIKELKTDPFALETVWISIIGFAGKSKIITPLQDIISFYPPKIPIGGGTSLSNGLNELMNAISRDVVKTTFEKKGDWKPLIFLFTDGVPTDNTDAAIERWNANYKNASNLVIISLGENTNYDLMGRLSNQVLKFNNTNAASYKEFFKWITASIKTTSERINIDNAEAIKLVKTNPELIENIDLSVKHQIPDENFVVIRGKCSKTNKQYLIKYQKNFRESGLYGMKTRMYMLEGAYKIDENSYKELSNETDYSLKVSADELMGNPSCPCCGNSYALATCSCGGIHCIAGEDSNSCPWCGIVAEYGLSEESFDINRTLG
ncbi:MAG: TerY-C metal binding domain-containing protein [Capnocytophaga sp.]|nr:TerY-C metal binding domain-containing protein [Capnocytophaga sp.]